MQWLQRTKSEVVFKTKFDIVGANLNDGFVLSTLCREVIANDELKSYTDSSKEAAQ